MFDSVNASAIPADASLVAGYIDGLYRWTPNDWARFPNARYVRIATSAATNAGEVLDVETGDATPDQAVTWTVARRRSGADPTVYVDSSRWLEASVAFARDHVTAPHWWVAAHPGAGRTIPPGAVAHQFADLGRYDLSVVADYWPGVDPIPLPVPPKGGPTMPIQPLPASAYPISDHSSIWRPDSQQLDLFILGKDSHLYHYWWETPEQAWFGPQQIDG